MSNPKANRSETAAHRELKRLAFRWAQGQGYAACALEVSLPKSRFRADVAAYRTRPNECTAIFECKQVRTDLRRDNWCALQTRQRLETVHQRCLVLEKHLRIHYPGHRISDSLFPEFDSHDFAAIDHRGYARVRQELTALQKRLRDGTKFETLLRYRCANVYFLVMPAGMFRESDIPAGWGALLESDGLLSLARKPVWHDIGAERGVHLLQRIAVAGTRALNRQLEITFDDVMAERARSL